jgi:iron complex transport system ATP-binding protein
VSTPLLATHRLTVTIAGRPVVASLDLTVAAGERLAILGRNGAGKTTLLHTLAGLRPPAAGSIELDGTPMEALNGRQAAQLRGLLAQQQTDAFPSTVLETALVGRHPHLTRWDWEGSRDERIARAALAAVGLEDIADRDIRSLSGGERQRVAIATLLAQEPRLMLLDEPMAHLDLNHQIAVLELLSSRAREQAAGIVMVIHDVNLALRYADRVLLLAGDGSHQSGSSAELLTAPTLSRLYGHPLREVGAGRHRHFVPD